MTPLFDYTITVLNKRAGRDSADKLDAWKKTVLHHCSWSSQAVRSVSGTTVSLGNAYVVRVPKSDAYRPYGQWIADMEGFTFSTGDYIIRGEIPDEVTPKTVQAIVNRYRPEAFEIKLFRDNTGTIEALEHYRLEGT